MSSPEKISSIEFDFEEVPTEEQPSAGLQASANPSEPLSASPAMGAALDEIRSGAPAARTRGNERTPIGGENPRAVLRAKVEAQRQVEATKQADLEEVLKASEAEPILPREDADALRAENHELRIENNSLQTLLRDQNQKVRKLADDLRQAYKERDQIVQVAEKMKHQRDLKPREIQKALNGISKVLK